MQIFVGTNQLQGDIARYAERFSMLELASGAPNLPRAARLMEWRRRVPAEFLFSIALPKQVCALEAAPLAPALEVAEALAASFFLVQTPPSVVPSARMRERLARLFEELTKAGRRIAWEPRGVWEDAEAEALAADASVHLVRDVARNDPPAGDTLYTRIRALGDAGQIRQSSMARVAEAIADREQAVVVIEGRGAARGARQLTEELGS